MVSSFITNEGIVVEDTSGRGRGSENTDKDAMRKRTSEQYHAIEAFVDYCNSKKGGGKCPLDQIKMYMQDGPRVGSEKQASTGKRLVVLHATTTDDFLCEYLDTGMGIPEDGLERETGGGAFNTAE